MAQYVSGQGCALRRKLKTVGFIAGLRRANSAGIRTADWGDAGEIKKKERRKN